MAGAPSDIGDFVIGESPIEGGAVGTLPAAYTTDDFTAALLALLPRGRVWPKEPDTVQAQAVATLTPTMARHAQDLVALLVDAFPATTLDLLPEWEATLGLPDPCAGLSPTVEQRVAQVVARFIGGGGQSVDYFIGFAAALGYAITIDEFAPFRCGIGRCGDPLCGADWAFAWQVNAPSFTVDFFECGVSVCGEPLAVWGNTVLQCELQRLSPAHTVLNFNYS